VNFDADGWLDVAQEYNISGNSFDRGGVPVSHLIIHGTAGGSDGSGTMNYMGNNGVSTHFAISTNGTIWQGVNCNAAAWGNAPLKKPRLNFARADLNPNLWTISIEFCKPDITNMAPITDAQKQSGFALIAAVCDHYHIPKRAGDGTSGIISHADINSVDRAHCPGTFPWNELWNYLKAGGKMTLPTGWTDDGTTLSCNGFKVTAGFRKRILAGLQAGTWRGDDMPCEEEHPADPLEYSNPQLKPGNKLRCLYSTLEYNTDKGVFQAYTGPELIYLEKLVLQQKAEIEALTQANATLTAENEALKNGGVLLGALGDLHKIYEIAAPYEEQQK
jgi:hypothetical protein